MVEARGPSDLAGEISEKGINPLQIGREASGEKRSTADAASELP
jgi:hypothetical protein